MHAVHSSSLVHCCSHSITEVHKVGKVGLALGKAMLAVLNYLPVLHVPWQSFWKDLLRDFTRLRFLGTRRPKDASQTYISALKYFLNHFPQPILNRVPLFLDVLRVFCSCPFQHYRSHARSSFACCE